MYCKIQNHKAFVELREIIYHSHDGSPLDSLAWFNVWIDKWFILHKNGYDVIVLKDDSEINE